MRSIVASYENGLLKPAHPLPLSPGEKVEILFVRKPDLTRWDLERLAVHGVNDHELSVAGLDAWATGLEAEDHH
jgi:predicted DNA-binding antitoxin AbrB/MazE fold protein